MMHNAQYVEGAITSGYDALDDGSWILRYYSGKDFFL